MKSSLPASPLKVNEPHPPPGKVYCPICTHTVEAQVGGIGRHAIVMPGQKCPRCKGSLDAGYILGPVLHAA